MRVDLVERIARAAHEARQGRKPFAPDPALATSMGLKPETLARLMAQLGFKTARGAPRSLDLAGADQTRTGSGPENRQCLCRPRGTVRWLTAMRLDRFLWFVRIAKKRDWAKGLAETGHLRIDGRAVAGRMPRSAPATS